MTTVTAYFDEAWDWEEHPSKPAAERFFSAYARQVNSRTFNQSSLTKWYSSKVDYRAETGKKFFGAAQMSGWMDTLFFSFERVDHVPEYFLMFPIDDGKTFRVHAGFRRQLWLKGNTKEEPDSDTPCAWVCEIGPADDEDGYMGLQFKKVTICWDKTLTVQLLGKLLPSD